jgi:hypothetical protein
MNDLYSVPVVINGVLQFLTVTNIPTTVGLENGRHYHVPTLLTVLRQARRQLENDGHDRYQIRIERIVRCVNQ